MLGPERCCSPSNGCKLPAPRRKKRQKPSQMTRIDAIFRLNLPLVPYRIKQMENFRCRTIRCAKGRKLMERKGKSRALRIALVSYDVQELRVWHNYLVEQSPEILWQRVPQRRRSAAGAQTAGPCGRGGVGQRAGRYGQHGVSHPDVQAPHKAAAPAAGPPLSAPKPLFRLRGRTEPATSSSNPASGIWCRRCW